MSEIVPMPRCLVYASRAEDVPHIVHIKHQASRATYPNTQLGITTALVDGYYDDISARKQDVFDKLANPDILSYVAETANTAAGFMFLDTSCRKIEELYILPEFQ